MRRLVTIRQAPSDGAGEQVRRREDRPGERDKGRDGREGDHQSPIRAKAGTIRRTSAPTSTTAGNHSYP